MASYLVSIRIDILLIYKYILFILISYDLYEFTEKYLIQNKNDTIKIIYFTKLAYCRVLLVNKESKDAIIIRAKIITKNHIYLVLKIMNNNKHESFLIEKNSDNRQIFHQIKYLISNQ